MLLQPLTSLAHLLLAERVLPMPTHPCCAAAGRAGAGAALGRPYPVAGRCRYPKNTHVQPTRCPQASLWPHYGQVAQKAAVLDRVGRMLYGVWCCGCRARSGAGAGHSPSEPEHRRVGARGARCVGVLQPEKENVLFCFAFSLLNKASSCWSLRICKCKQGTFQIIHQL